MKMSLVMDIDNLTQEENDFNHYQELIKMGKENETIKKFRMRHYTGNYYLDMIKWLDDAITIAKPDWQQKGGSVFMEPNNNYTQEEIITYIDYYSALLLDMPILQ